LSLPAAKTKKQIRKKFKQRKSRFSKVPKRSLSRSSHALVEVGSFFESSNGPFFDLLFLSCVMFSADEEKRFEVYMVSNFVFLVLVCPRTPKKQKTNKQAHKQTPHKQILSFYFFSH
jgi:hypothetical protein